LALPGWPFLEQHSQSNAQRFSREDGPAAFVCAGALGAPSSAVSACYAAHG